MYPYFINKYTNRKQAKSITKMDEERNIEPQILIDVSYKKCSKIDYVTSEAFELHGKEKNNNNKTIKV